VVGVLSTTHTITTTGGSLIMDGKEYFLSVSKKEAKEISDALNRLFGFVTATVDAGVDPEHGPVNATAELMQTCRGPLERLTMAFSHGAVPIQDLNKVVEQSKKELVNSIISVLSSDATGMDLVTKLHSTLENYEIIGRKQFGKESGDEDLPF
jgi:hypothetical protein